MMLSFRSDEPPDSTDHPYTRKGQTLYLVFESALLLRFSSCIHCSSHTSVKLAGSYGSFRRATTVARDTPERTNHMWKIFSHLLPSSTLEHSHLSSEDIPNPQPFHEYPEDFFAISASIYSQ